MRPILDSASSAEPSAWETYAPLLDDALLRLRAKDRDALTLRYLKGLPLHDVGALLGISEEAARKRVDRALQHLHARIAVKAALPWASALTAAIAALPMHAAPAGLADSITRGAAAKSALASAISHAGAKWMAWAQLKNDWCGGGGRCYLRGRFRGVSRRRLLPSPRRRHLSRCRRFPGVRASARRYCRESR